MVSRILEAELEDLQFDIQTMALLVEKATKQSVKSLIQDDSNLAREIIALDDQIDDLYHIVQSKCLRLLALRQPVAVDLRTIHSDLLIAGDLERMGDYAESIARTTLQLVGQRTLSAFYFLPEFAEMVNALVHDTIAAYILGDVSLAVNAAVLEDEIDRIYRHHLESLTAMIKKVPECTDTAVQLILVGHFLERIADHATNVGEAVVYMVKGEKVDLNK